MQTGAEWTMDERGSRHIVQVLRLRKGDLLVAFNGQSQAQFLAEITFTSKREARVRIKQRLDDRPVSPLRVHVAQAVSRGERMDYAIQKSVELGVAEITPVLTERCGVKIDADRQQKRMNHWYGVAMSAAEQSGRCELPLIHPICRYEQWLQAVKADCRWVAMPSTEVGANLQQRDKPTSLAVLIGPEGGLTDVEAQRALDAGFDAVQLGPRVLRTETAPVVVLSVAQFLWGDF